MSDFRRLTYKEIIMNAPDAIYKTLEYNKEKKFRISNESNKVYFIGSGSSYSVALYGGMLFNQYTDYQTFAMSPREFIELGHPKSTVILISQGGWNVDIIDVAKKAISDGCMCTAITESLDSPFASIIGEQNIMQLKLEGEKECFANSQGVVAACAIVLQFLDKIKSTDFAMVLICSSFNFSLNFV